MRYWRKRQEPFDLEAELRAGRPEPSSEFVHRLETRVRNHGRSRAAGGLRVAFVGALTAVMLMSLASVGGVGYASSAGKDAVVSVKRVVTPERVRVVKVLKKSAAIDQYKKKPKAKKKAKKVKKAKKGQGAKGRVRARTRPPFTG